MVASISIRQDSFAGGELAPTLHGRSDIARYAIGLARCLNFFVAPHGVLLNRPGLMIVNQTKNSGVVGDAPVRLIPFIFSSSEAYVLEFGHLYMRVHALGATILSGGVPYELVTPYTKDEVKQLKWAQLGNSLTITHLNHPPMELVRIAANNWTLTAIVFLRAAATAGAPTFVTDPVHLPDATHPGKDWQYIVTQVYTSPDGVTRETRRSGVSFNRVWALPTVFDLGEIVTTNFARFYTSLQAGNSGHTPPAVGSDAFWASGIAVYTDMPLTIDFTESAFPGGTVVNHNVYKGRHGIFGFIGSTTGTRFVDDGIPPDFTVPPPAGAIPFSAENPAVVAYFEQRRVFARTASKPQTVWLSASGDYTNYDDVDFPTDASAIEFTLAGNQYEEIRSLVPGRDLLILTQSGEWSIDAQQGPVAPSNLSVRLHSRRGSNVLSALPVGSALLFAQARGTSVRDLQFDWQSVSYTGSEVSLLASHLFPAAVSTDGRNYAATVADWAFSLVPYSIAWIVRSDGVLLGLTYNKEQEIVAWHQHDTQGTFESVCAIPEDQEDAVYVSVLRNGLRFIERMATRNIDWDIEQRKCCFLDCAQTFDVTGTPSATFTLKAPLASVWGLVDGAVVGPLPVVGGVVTLEEPVEIATFGLLYTSELQLLDIVLPRNEGRTKIKNVWKGVVEVYASRGLKGGSDFGHLYDLILREVSDDYGAPKLYTGQVEIGLTQTIEKAGRAVIRQVDPLPATIVAVTREVVIGGD